MKEDSISIEEEFDRLNQLTKKAENQENFADDNPGKEKGASPVVLDSSSDVPPAPTGNLEEDVPTELTGSRKKSSSGLRYSGGKKPAVTGEIDQMCTIHYYLPNRKRSMLKFVAINRGKSMNACINEAVDKYIASFIKEFRKKYGANEQTLQMIIDDMSGND